MNTVSVSPCLCYFSIQPSVLALSLLRQEIEAIQSEDMLEIAYHIQRHLKVNNMLLDCTTQQLIQGGKATPVET